MDNQAFTRADVGNNRVARDRSAALGKGNQHTVGAFDRQMAVAG